VTEPLSKVYGRQYFSWQREGAASSADAMLPLVLDLVSPSSILDVGCGTGVWLRTALDHGIQDVLGVDGGTSERVIPAEKFRQLDFAEPLEFEGRFDLVICMEVAEHLPPERASSFVAELCRAADVVLFSAAIPGQAEPGSVVHQNEQWQSYWAELFSALGYRTIDAIRPLIWTNDAIAVWYRQNAFLAVSPDKTLQLDGATSIADVVHPDLWSFVNAELWTTTAGPRQLLRQLPRATRRAVQRRLTRH
jgi:SAM-dependent methyltransferase